MITKDTLQFLEDLKNNNYRDWFQANQDRYEDYKKDYRDTVDAFLDVMKPLDETLEPLEFKDCSYRINRDIRFSKDKTPYKTHMGIWMCEGKKNTNLAGYYVHIEPDSGFAGGGLYMPEASELKKVRREIDGFYDELEDILNAPDFKKVYGRLDTDEGMVLKSAPKDFDKNHPAIELLKFKTFLATAKLSKKDLLSKTFVQDTAEKLIVLKPLVEFLNRALATE
ncbi:hypothetical protein AM493_19460 [Flavobacterium akiainvivens]|uniref:TIGR02453 family protein n=1 Tax=Flavobacterium akiainvivens TaxID=1202724 RepID=A0A0M9VJQ2_9FLAO|nr:DUF2461 domain-containing protein [Flavobacterium akiainvivens]KOS07986.1 hypothetical protein AM493_19460 [Flavobacterium akiainvivens]SFQ61594.1 TIGR02453 family protein [Flavobacterium akiainvivens]